MARAKWVRAAQVMHARRVLALSALVKRIEGASTDDLVDILLMLDRGEFGELSDVDLAACYSAAARALELLAGSLRQNGGG